MLTRKELEAHQVQKGSLSCDSDAPQVGSARSDSTSLVIVNRRKMNRRKTKRRKTKPHCIIFTLGDVQQVVYEFISISCLCLFFCLMEWNLRWLKFYFQRQDVENIHIHYFPFMSGVLPAETSVDCVPFCVRVRSSWAVEQFLSLHHRLKCSNKHLLSV